MGEIELRNKETKVPKQLMHDILKQMIWYLRIFEWWVTGCYLWRRISSASYVISEEESPEESPRHSLGMVVGESSFAMNGGGGDVEKYQKISKKKFLVGNRSSLSNMIIKKNSKYFLFLFFLVYISFYCQYATLLQFFYFYMLH